MSQEQDEGNYISEEGYQEQPQVEVACLNDWERLHLGEQASDSEDELQWSKEYDKRRAAQARFDLAMVPKLLRPWILDF